MSLGWALTGSLTAAEELAQDTLTAAWKDWDQVGTYDRPGAWARRAVINRAAGARRRAGREQRALGRFAGRRTGEATLEISEENEALWQAVRSLPARQAQAVVLHYLEDRPVREIAAILECAEATVKVHLHRGRQALARRLDLMEEQR